MTQRYSDSPDSYQGPWQWYGRDVDPTLQPSARVGGRRVAPNGLIDFDPLSCVGVNTTEPDDAEDWARHVDPFPQPHALLAGHATDSNVLQHLAYPQRTTSAVGPDLEILEDGVGQTRCGSSTAAY